MIMSAVVAIIIGILAIAFFLSIGPQILIKILHIEAYNAIIISLIVLIIILFAAIYVMKTQPV